MTKLDEDWFDPDIAAMELWYGEKAGLQIYRNYTRSFEEHAIKRFVEAIDQEPLDLTDFHRLAALIVTEEARFLPVIVCAFADNLLEVTFKAVLPNGIPGGKRKMFGGYGPLSDLAKRIQLAFFPPPHGGTGPHPLRAQCHFSQLERRHPKRFLYRGSSR